MQWSCPTPVDRKSDGTDDIEFYAIEFLETCPGARRALLVAVAGEMPSPVPASHDDGSSFRGQGIEVGHIILREVETERTQVTQGVRLRTRGRHGRHARVHVIQRRHLLELRVAQGHAWMSPCGGTRQGPPRLQVDTRRLTDAQEGLIVIAEVPLHLVTAGRAPIAASSV